MLTSTASLSTSGVTINGAGAKLIQNSTATLSAPVALTLGTLNGTGTIDTVTVADTASAVIANGGLTGAATFTVNSLTFGGAATFTPVLSAPGAAPAVATATLVNGSGLVTVNPSVLAATPTWAAGRMTF